MTSRRFYKLFLLLIVLSLAAGCTAAPTPTPTPTSLPSPTELPTDTPTPVPPTPTDTPVPTATATATLPPTSTPTEVPPTATNTPKPTLRPTQPPAPTAAPAAAKATAPASMPGVDVVAVRGQETCVNKFVNVSYEWQGEQDPKGRKMFYWDEKWSVYPMYARPNIKFDTVISSCNKDKQCNGFSADFCVYVDGGAPPGGTYETEVILIIASGYPPAAPGRPITGPALLATTTAKFSWYIK